MLHNTASMWRKEHQRHSQALQATKVLAPEHPSMRTLLGSPDAEILKVAEQPTDVSLQWHPAYSLRQQNECMRVLPQELTTHMARVGLQGESGLARSTERGRRCSHSHSAPQTCSPSAGPWRVESAK